MYNINRIKKQRNWYFFLYTHLYFEGTTQFFYVLGPFDELPPNLIHDIWLCLKTRKLLRRHHGFLLISPFFSKLDLSNSETDFNLFLHLATQRCFMLTQLSLSHNKLSRDLITKTLPSFTKLTSLSMSYSNVTDNQVQCPAKENLDILMIYSGAHKKCNDLRIHYRGTGWFCSYFQVNPRPYFFTRYCISF